MKNYSLVLILIYSLVSCTAINEEVPIELITTKKINLDERAQESLHRVYTSVAVSSTGDELAFSNYLSPISVVITDLDGKFVETIGGEGRGPKEIESARFLGFDQDDNLVVLDKANSFFKVFNREMDEVSSFDYKISNGISIESRIFEKCSDKWYLAIQQLGKPTKTDISTIGIYDSTFTLTSSFGGYDPFFEGRNGIMRETQLDLDCGSEALFTIQAKTPFIQVFSIKDETLQGRTDVIPPSFMLSDKFLTMVTSSLEMSRYMTEEQSLSLKIGHSDKYIYHIFRNDRNNSTIHPRLNERDHFVAVYDKSTLNYIGEKKLPGAVLGFTKEGELIVLIDESSFKIEFIQVLPSNKHDIKSGTFASSDS